MQNIESYKSGNYEKALTDAFLGIDSTLLEDEVIQKLKRLVPDSKQNETDSDRDEDEEDLRQLCRESKMPLSELLANISGQNPLENCQNAGESSGSSSGYKTIEQIIRAKCAKWKNGVPCGSSSSEEEEDCERSILIKANKVSGN